MQRHTNGIFEVYKADNNEWYWRLKAPNHKIIAVGGEGFSTKQACIHSIKAVAHYVTKQIHSRRGQQCDICEIDENGTKHVYPTTHQAADTLTLRVSDDTPGAELVRDGTLVEQEKAVIRELDTDEEATPPVKNAIKRLPPKPQPTPTIDELPEEHRGVFDGQTGEPIPSKVIELESLTDIDPDNIPEEVMQEIFDKVQELEGKADALVITGGVKRLDHINNPMKDPATGFGNEGFGDTEFDMEESEK